MDERHFLIEGFRKTLNNIQEVPLEFKWRQYTLEESLYVHEEHEEFSEEPMEDSFRETELNLEKKPFETYPLPDLEDIVPIAAVDASAIPLSLIHI